MGRKIGLVLSLMVGCFFIGSTVVIESKCRSFCEKRDRLFLFIDNFFCYPNFWGH